MARKAFMIGYIVIATCLILTACQSPRSVPDLVPEVTTQPTEPPVVVAATPSATAMSATATLVPSPTPTLTATPTPLPLLDPQPGTLDPDWAANFMAGAGSLHEDYGTGMTFHDRVTGAVIYLHPNVVTILTNGQDTSPESIALALVDSQWGRTLDLHINPSRTERQGNVLRFNYDELVVFDRDGEVYAWEYDSPNRTFRLHRLRANGSRQTFRQGYTLPGTRDQPLVRWNADLGLVLTNGWRMTHHFDHASSRWSELETPVEWVQSTEEQAAITAELLQSVPGFFNRRRYAFSGYLTTRDNQMIIAYGGRNGLPEEQARRLKQWIDWALESSPEFRQLFHESDVRFLVRDDDYLDRWGWGASPDVVATNWGIIYHRKNDWAIQEGLMGWNVQLIMHESSRIWNEHMRPGCGVNNRLTVEVETRLLESLRSAFSAADWNGANAVLALHRQQRDRPCARLG